MNLFEFEQINEVPMNPTAYAGSTEEASTQGVLVGFEFECCIPEATVNMPLEPVVSDGIPLWIKKVLKANTKWWNYLDIDSIFENELVELRNSVTYLGKSYKDLDDLYEAWKSSKIEPKVKNAFNSCSESDRLAIVRDWEDSLKNRVYTKDTPTNFCRSAMDTLTYENPNYKRFRNIYYTEFKDIDFWNEMFGTYNLNELAANPTLRWDGEGILYYVESMQDDYSGWGGGGTIYKKSSKVLQHFLAQKFNKKFTIFNSYHEKKKNMTDWYIEPDGSIEPVGSDDSSAEVVTPPMPVKEAIDALKMFYQTARELKLYTNESTGLHINVSIPAKLDVLKLAIFTGDLYVLQQFKREDNEYAESVLQSLSSAIDNNYGYDETMPNLNKKSHLRELVTIAKDISDNHTASISYNGKYVSFRHAGGNYLNEQQDVLNVVGRFVRAMVIASNPALYRKEYMAKLTKLLRVNDEQNVKVHGIGDIMKLKTSPISVQAIALFGTNGNGTTGSLKNNSDYLNNDMVIIDLLAARPHLDSILAACAANGKILPGTVNKISKYPNSRLLAVNQVNQVVPYKANTIYQGYNGGPIGVEIKAPLTLQPGDPAHTFLCQLLINRFKETMAHKKRQKELDARGAPKKKLSGFPVGNR